MTIRSATKEEMLSLWGYKDVNTASPTAIFFHNNISSGNTIFWTVEEDDELIGELYVFKDLSDKDFADGTSTAYLCAFRVREDYRGQGIGSKLLEHVLDDIKSKGFSKATIGVSPDEERNLKLYKSFGFNNKVKECYVDPCALDDKMQPKKDSGFWLLEKELY